MSLCCPCSSCGCNNGSCGCKFVVNVNSATGVEYSATNINLTGVGVYDSQAGNEFQFRGVASANNSLTVTLDNTNHTVLLTLDVDLLVDDLPQATTTQRGVGETATDAEAIAKASTAVFVTPSNFASMGASTSFAGFIEIATNAEALAGVSSTLAITPASLTAVVNTIQQLQIWNDAVARLGAAPAYQGQLGVQNDTSILWISSGTSVGDFDVPVFVLDSVNNSASANTLLQLNGNNFEIQGGTFIYQGGAASFDNGSLRIGTSAGTDFDLGGSITVQISGVPIPANSIWLTGAGAGQPSSALINEFLSSFGTDTGWTNFANSTVRKTGDCNTITLPQLAQVVDTLIQTLGTARLIPIP